jgi:diguanylate cyclase (GGDEF)-like protein
MRPGRTLPRNFTGYLEQRSRVFHAAFGTVLLVLIGVLDYATGRELSFSVFYLLPISYFAWYVTTEAGLAVAILSAAALLAVNVDLKSPYRVVPYVNIASDLTLFLIMTWLVTQVRTLYVREREASRVDFLTGMPNWRAFYEAVTAEKVRAKRYERPMSIAYLDLDDFKKVNDTYGHQTGDTLLQLVGKIMRNNLRETDLAARLGGDEFAILLPETAADAAETAMDKLRRELLHQLDENGFQMTFSMGLVTFLKPPDATDEMVRQADRLMYSVKTSGKNRIAQGVSG